jgi:hypothetical protein
MAQSQIIINYLSDKHGRDEPWRWTRKKKTTGEVFLALKIKR